MHLPRFSLKDMLLAVGLIVVALSVIGMWFTFEVFDSSSLPSFSPGLNRLCRAAAVGGLCGLLVFLWKLGRS